MAQSPKLTLYHSLPNRSSRVVELIEVSPQDACLQQLNNALQSLSRWRLSD